MHRQTSKAFLLFILLCLPLLVQAAEKDQSRAELEKALAQTRQELNETARKVAELSRELAGKNMVRVREIADVESHGRLGIMISGESNDAGDGVNVVGVTPGGPADKAGIKSGDLLLAINGKALAADNGALAADKLMTQLRDIKPEQQVTLRYRRDGKTAEAKVTTGASLFSGFAWHGGDADDFAFSLPPMQPGMATAFAFLRPGWGDMELVDISPALGEYFGTDKGVLVVRAPSDNSLQLKDGDVILKIGERVPEGPVHAMRILRSYRPGEALQLTIMRQDDEMQLNITLPDAEPTAMRFLPEKLEKAVRVIRPL